MLEYAHFKTKFEDVMKKQDVSKQTLDLDAIEGKPLSECSPEEIAEMLEPFRDIASRLQEPIRHTLLTSQRVNLAQIVSIQQQLANKIIEDSNVSKQISQMFAAAIDSRKIAESLFQSVKPAMDALNRSIIDLGSLNSVGRLGDSYIKMAVRTAKQISEKQALIEGAAVSEVSYKSVSVSQEAKVEVTVATIGSKLEKKLEKQDQELSDIKAMLRQLIENPGESLPATVTNFKFNLSSLTLVINGKKVPYKSPNKQTQICQLFFSDSNSINKKLHIEDIICAFGEEITKDRITEWNKQFYQATRHLNTRIAEATGLKNFILVRRQYYEINPKYKKLF